MAASSSSGSKAAPHADAERPSPPLLCEFLQEPLPPGQSDPDHDPDHADGDSQSPSAEQPRFCTLFRHIRCGQRLRLRRFRPPGKVAIAGQHIDHCHERRRDLDRVDERVFAIGNSQIKPGSGFRPPLRWRRLEAPDNHKHDKRQQKHKPRIVAGKQRSGHKAGSGEQGAGERGAGSRERGAGSREQRAGSREQRAESRGAESRERGAGEPGSRGAGSVSRRWLPAFASGGQSAEQTGEAESPWPTLPASATARLPPLPLLRPPLSALRSRLSALRSFPGIALFLLWKLSSIEDLQRFLPFVPGRFFRSGLALARAGPVFRLGLFWLADRSFRTLGNKMSSDATTCPDHRPPAGRFSAIRSAVRDLCRLEVCNFRRSVVPDFGRFAALGSSPRGRCNPAARHS